MNKILFHIIKNRLLYVLLICLITFLAKGISKKIANIDSLEFIKEIVLGFVILDFSIHSFYIDKELKDLNQKLIITIGNLEQARGIKEIRNLKLKKNEIENLIESKNRARENYNPMIFGFIYGALAIVTYMMK